MQGNRAMNISATSAIAGLANMRSRQYRGLVPPVRVVASTVARLEEHDTLGLCSN
jgi:hypothetical protein